MAVFYVLLFVPIMIQHFTVNSLRIDYEKKNRHALLFFFALLTLLVMFRHERVGTDTETYIYYFNKFAQSQWNEITDYYLEFGFSFFNKFLSLFSKNPQFFLAVVAIVISLMIYPTYKRLCTDASLTIVLFCTMSTFVMMFSGLRQMLAVAIGFIAYNFTVKKKPVHFVIAVLVAMAFHTSAFMLFFMYYLYHAKITKKWLWFIIPAIAVAFVFNKQIFSVLAYVLERYTDYDASISQTGAYTMFILFTIFAVFSFLIPDETLLDKETIGLRNFLLLSLVIQIFAPLHTIAMRMNYYYIIFIPLLMPKVISCSGERVRQVAVISRHIMVAFFLIYFFISAYGGGNLKVFPYHFFWENI